LRHRGRADRAASRRDCPLPPREEHAMTPDNHDDACPHISGEEAAECASNLTRDQIMLTLNVTRPCGCRVTLAVIAGHNGFTENPDWCGCHLLNRAMLIELLAASTSELATQRSEEHTSELQSRENLVCRLLLEKKKSARLYL